MAFGYKDVFQFTILALASQYQLLVALEDHPKYQGNKIIAIQKQLIKFAIPKSAPCVLLDAAIEALLSPSNTQINFINIVNQLIFADDKQQLPEIHFSNCQLLNDLKQRQIQHQCADITLAQWYQQHAIYEEGNLVEFFLGKLIYRETLSGEQQTAMGSLPLDQLDADDYCQILNVNKDASREEVEQAYQQYQQSLSDPTLSRIVNYAYSVLTQKTLTK